MPNECPALDVAHITDRRYVRVGACPVLEVTVTYPRIGTGEAEEDAAVSRFNEAYRAMAEAFLAWALDAPAREAVEAFGAEGVSAMYCFDRRVILCRMTADISPDGGISDVHCLSVEREARYASRRGRLAEKHFVEKDFWRLPAFELFRPRRNGGGEPSGREALSVSADGTK